MGMNGAYIVLHLWLIIAARSTNDYDEKSSGITPETNFLSTSQKTLSTSHHFNNLTQQPHRQHDENRLLKEKNHKIQHDQKGKEEESTMDSESGSIEDSVAVPFTTFPTLTFARMDASNDTQLIPPANSSILQNIAFPVLPNNEEQQNGKSMLSNNTEAFEENKNDNKKYEEDSGLNSNAIDEELEIRRKMERTTIEVRNYPPVIETSPSYATTSIPSIDFEYATTLMTPVTSISLSFTPDYSVSQSFDFGPHKTVSHRSLTSSLPSYVGQDHHDNWELIQRINATELSSIPSFISASAPFALPIPLGKAETSFNLFDTQLRNSGISALISNGHFWNANRIDATRKNGALERYQLQEKFREQMQLHTPVDDVLGCTWDIVTNSCKDLFSLKLCSHCHDFGNIFLHNCKCLVKYMTAF
ncbi:Glycine dehydrogenase (decarboxylating) [Dirofilaria immitis]